MRFLCVRGLTRVVSPSLIRNLPSCDSLALSHTRLVLGCRWISFSSPGGAPPRQDDVPDVDPLQDQSMGLAQRFKRTFKQYGKVMIPVHLLTSCMWFGGFYYAAMK